MDEKEFDTMLEKYADVIVTVGLGMKKDQVLFINGNLEDAPLVRKIIKSAYRAGAKFVDVIYADEQATRIRFEYSDPENIGYVPDWIYARYDRYMQDGEARLFVSSINPDLYDGIDPDLVSKGRHAIMERVIPLQRKYENNYNWCIAASAAPAWSKKVFPGIPVEEAQAKLWEAIFKACRIDQQDPVAAWAEHTNKLAKYKKYLNNKRYASLHYKSSNTDLTVGLPERQVWADAQGTFKNGVTCMVNIPTEEVFTSPHREKVNGHVKATLPLNWLGVLIDDFAVTFEKGRAVNVIAKKGENDLRKMIEMDDNASRLGEVALVPNSSPIKQSGILFYNTIFDENASCHIAFGNAFRACFEGGDGMTNEEFEAAGGNKSILHTDFMIGSSDMDIDGITSDGTREPVMRQGEWAFDL